jgi:hypothetical protein
MALVAKSTGLTGFDATPSTKLGTSYYNGSLRKSTGYMAAASATFATVGQWFTFVRVPARARLISVECTNATASSGYAKVGLYRTPANGGAAVKDSNISAGFNLGTANNRARVDSAMSALQTSQIISDAFATEIGTASATADVEFDIGLTVLTVVGSAVDITIEVSYVDND